MVGYDPRNRKKYCDLFCNYCEGLIIKECVMNNQGYSMNMLRAQCMAQGKLLTDFVPRSEHWCEHIVLTPEILGGTNFPVYDPETVH